ncbi:MAG: hypothetical protein OEU36_21880 [Gammaproteobacteria bacterium]|nr:hypothetical protein [Gammaproteobacteria bacterium]
MAKNRFTDRQVSKDTNRHSRGRRALLKALTAGGSAAVAGKVAPEEWTKPVVDSILLPAHAQMTPGPTTFVATVGVIDEDNPLGGLTNLGGPFNTGTAFVSDGAAGDLADTVDDMFFSVVSAELDPPPVAAQDATLTFSSATGIDGIPAPVVASISTVTGIANFPGSFSFDADSDPPNESITLTFSTAGVPDQVLTFTFT